MRFEDFEGKREFDLGDYKRIKRGETAAGEQTANDEERVRGWKFGNKRNTPQDIHDCAPEFESIDREDLT